jgi:NADPH2:quinone reductase
MRAAICRSYGPPEVVRVEELASPELAAGQVRVRVGAASVNFSDVLLLANEYQMSVPTPFVPGSEFAGVVAEVAADVVGLAAGDRVAGTGLVGAFAEEAVVATRSLIRVPATVEARLAAAFGVAYRTAYHALRSIARIRPGEQLIVLGAGGGVGLAAVEIGVLLGASVTAVASSAEKLEAAAARGAQNLINHRTAELRPALRSVLPGGADVVIDPVGGDLAEPALRTLHWGGRFVTLGYASGAVPRIPLNLVLLKGVQVLGFQLRDFAANVREDFQRNEAELADLLAEGRLRPHIGAVFGLDEVAAALRHVADGRAVGKVVLDIR